MWPLSYAHNAVCPRTDAKPRQEYCMFREAIQRHQKDDEEHAEEQQEIQKEGKEEEGKGCYKETRKKEARKKKKCSAQELQDALDVETHDNDGDGAKKKA